MRSGTEVFCTVLRSKHARQSTHDHVREHRLQRRKACERFTHRHRHHLTTPPVSSERSHRAAASKCKQFNASRIGRRQYTTTSTKYRPHSAVFADTLRNTIYSSKPNIHKHIKPRGVSITITPRTNHMCICLIEAFLSHTTD